MSKTEKKKVGLTTRIFISLILGAIAGVLLHYFVPSGQIRDDIIINGIFYVVGQGFIRLMQMLVAPLVFCCLRKYVYRGYKKTGTGRRKNNAVLPCYNCLCDCVGALGCQCDRSGNRVGYLIH